MSAPRSRVPTTLVTGVLGVGKTTAILDAFEHRPPGERWAVVVNEFGDVGLDGAILQEGGAGLVREIPGGCICCTSGPQLQLSLVRLLREQRPDRLFIEPTGLASPASILDMLRAPGLTEAIDLRAVITLVEPAHLLRPAHLLEDVFLAQVEVADVLVANKVDRASADDLAAFRAAAAALWPPKLVVAETTHGRLDPAWLDLDPSPPQPGRVPVVASAPNAASAGWVFGPDAVFPAHDTRELLQRLMVDHPALPAGLLRLKAILRTDQGWRLVQGQDDALSFTPFAHRRDSRIELIAPVEPAPDWGAVGEAIAGLVGGEGARGFRG